MGSTPGWLHRTKGPCLARIPEEIIQRVQEAVDIADVISRYATLKRAGRNFKALCPFHEEKTPSFTVFPESQRFKCFGCGEGGNVFTFLMKHNNLGFRDDTGATSGRWCCCAERGYRRHRVQG